MDSNVFDAVEVIFTKAWKMMCSLDFPGTNISIAAILLGSALVVFGLRLLGKMFGFSSESDVRALGGYAQGGGNNKNIKVPDNRKGDKN